MKRILAVSVAAIVAIFLVIAKSGAGAASWTEEFGFDKSELSSTGSNPFFILEPGYQMCFEKGDERLTITVLDETKVVDGVETRVVEEREGSGDVIEEISRNYFAISNKTNSVFYFGEDSADYNEQGEVTGRGGSWLAGSGGARPGLIMPGLPLLGARYYQEIAPKVAMDRAEIASISDTVEVPAGRFENVLKTIESSPLEPLAKENKVYARGVGLLKDGKLELTKYGYIQK